MSLNEVEARQQLKDDFAFYARNNLKIRAKSGAVVPFVFNAAQIYLHERLEAQANRTGRVRAIILKGRQQGCSTYVEGRLYWRVTHRRGVRAFILTHEQEATNNLFEMVQRYHEYCLPSLKPQTDASNAKELVFGALDSGYRLGTAGTKGVGRSSTIQYFHGSEVAFWPHADEHAAGVMQAIPDAEGTEVILESTANGMGNSFHRLWQQAEAGLSEYQAIFIPWFWQEEYSRAAGGGFAPMPDEAEYADSYALNNGQIAWMRNKLSEFKGDWALFHQEYPATAALAFQSSGDESFVPPALVAKARKLNLQPSSARLGGLDPARFGDDRTALVVRQGRKVVYCKTWSKKDTMEVAGLGVAAIKEQKLDKLFVDVGGLGAGVYDRLREMGYGDKVMAVNAGDRALDEDHYINKRAEMWGKLKEWLGDPGGADIPDDDVLHADLTAAGYGYDSSQRLKLERKEDIKKRGLLSPDLGDALALTFAFPIGGALSQPLQYNTKWVR